MALGILDQLGLAASLVFAIPVGAYGLQQAAGGSPIVGATFVVVALLMVYLPQRLTTPGDVPVKAAEKVVSASVGTDSEDDETGANGGTGDDTDDETDDGAEGTVDGNSEAAQGENRAANADR